MKYLIILLVIVGLIVAGLLYIKQRIRGFIQRMVDPRQFMGQQGSASGKSVSGNKGGPTVYEKDGIRITKGDAKE
ncbi:MAG: hypothetical protein Kapaf2KO_00130 [Candidatus Kapaibacteriales bacterium]